MKSGIYIANYKVSLKIIKLKKYGVEAIFTQKLLVNLTNYYKEMQVTEFRNVFFFVKHPPIMCYLLAYTTSKIYFFYNVYFKSYIEDDSEIC